MISIVASLLEAVACQQQGRTDQAELIYKCVIEHEPEQPNALYLYGLLQLNRGHSVEAATLLQRATRFRDDYEVWMNLARARLANGDYAATLCAVQEALVRGAPRVPALYVQGSALNGCRRSEEAVAALSEAAHAAPGHAAIRLNLGNAMADLDHLAEAKGHIEAAIVLDPRLVEAHASLGYVLASMGELDGAIIACERALEVAPDASEAHWNLATAALLAGNFERGFVEYAWRKRHARFRHHFHDLPGRVWTGEPLGGQTLLVSAEQGYGDTIQLTRFFPLLAKAGARVVLAVGSALVPLLKAQPGLSMVVSKQEPLPAYDFWVDQMTLPQLLELRPDNIPGSSGYISADPERRRIWAERLPDARIGVVWAGNPLHSNDHRRSISAKDLTSLVIPGMVSLQTGLRADEAEALGLPNVSNWLADYAETAALIANLELVITVDTSVAHLAGALGVPTWIMLPHAPDWRWILGRDDTPWYDTVRLFRQTRPGDWADVITRVRSALLELNPQAAWAD